MKIGVQFYTLREQCRTLEDFAESLQKVADIGYTTVQISGTCAYEAAWLQEQLKKTGLHCVITHTPFDKIRDHTRQVIEEHSVFGCSYIGIGAGPNMLGGAENMQQMLELAHGVAPLFRENGKRLMYHHHSPEFTRDCPDNRTRLDYLLSRTTPEELGITLDTYWVQAGGADVAAMIRQLAGRIPCVHLKDMALCEWEQRMAPVGYGNLNWSAILPALEAAEVQYALVEQDNCYEEDPFACLKKSYDFLHAQGLA